MSYSVESGQIIGSDGEVYCLAELLGETDSLGACRNPKTYSPRSGNIVGADGEIYNLVDLIVARNVGVKTALPATCAVNTIYDIGVQTTVSVVLPTGRLGDFIQIDFISGATPATLSITSTAALSDFDLTCEANHIYTVYAEWGQLESGVYGWKLASAEYTRTVTP